MSLRQQFSWLTSALVVVLLLGNLYVTISHGRHASEQQLNARAYDAATSLAVAMSQLQAPSDAHIGRLMDALYDRGFFAEIRFHAISGNSLERKREHLSGRFPQWLPVLLPLRNEMATADVTQQWQQLGRIEVLSDQQLAYQHVWGMIQAELLWSLLVLIVALFLLRVLLTWMLRPLADVEAQANAICERQWQQQETLPKARELRRVVLAMNKMVAKLQSMFSEQIALVDQLREDSYLDSVTGLLNRRGYDQRVQHVLSRAEEHSGVLMLLQLHDFAAYNSEQGRAAGDAWLVSLAQCLQRACAVHSLAIIGRRSGADFALYVSCAHLGQAQQIINDVFAALSSRTAAQQRHPTMHLGGVFLQGHHADLSQALSRADMALRQAQRHSQGGVQLYQCAEADNEQAELSATQWQHLLSHVLLEQAIELQFMPVLNRQQRLVQIEVYSRIHRQGQTLSAARFWPLVEQWGLAADYDLCIIEKVLSCLSEHDPGHQVGLGMKYCLNVSAASLRDARFQPALLRLLRRYQPVSANLAFEFPEGALTTIEAYLPALAEALADLGVSLGVDQVGTGNMAFAWLQRLPLHYIRLDGSFNRGVYQTPDHQFFVQAMLQIAHSLDLIVMAEGVEQVNDVESLLQMGIDGHSGYVLTQPLATLQQVSDWVDRLQHPAADGCDGDHHQPDGNAV